MSGAETQHRSLGIVLSSMIGRGAFLARRSDTGRGRGELRRENAGMSSERKVRILSAEYPRFPG